MINELLTIKHPVFKCSNMLQTGALMKRKRGGGVGEPISKKESDNHRMLVNRMSQ